MLRELMVDGGLAVDATFKADAAMSTGMGVVKNFTDGTADFPAAATGDDIFLVQKGRYPTGINAARTEFSDWDDEFNTVKAGELTLLYSFPNGSKFGTDQYDATTAIAANKGKRFLVGTDGKWTVATSTATSKYEFIDTYTENGHTLAKLYVHETAVANT